MAWHRWSSQPGSQGEPVRPGRGGDLVTAVFVAPEDFENYTVHNISLDTLVECPHCRTRGCEVCGGTGAVAGSRTHDFTVLPSFAYGTRVLVPSMGEAGRRGGKPGNLWVEIWPAPLDGGDVFMQVRLGWDDYRRGVERFDVDLMVWRTCPACEGYGGFGRECFYCRFGLRAENVKLPVTIPPADKRDSDQIVIEGAGSDGRFGGRAGDVVVSFEEPELCPSRLDLLAVLELTEAETYTGATKTVFVETPRLPCPDCIELPDPGGCPACNFEGYAHQRRPISVTVGYDDPEVFHGNYLLRRGEGLVHPEAGVGDLYVLIVPPATIEERNGVSDDYSVEFHIDPQYWGPQAVGMANGTHYPVFFRCPECGGHGCDAFGPGGCEGRGFMRGVRNFGVDLPAGINPNDHRPFEFTMPGYGHDARFEGGRDGDLYVTLYRAGDDEDDEGGPEDTGRTDWRDAVR